MNRHSVFFQTTNTIIKNYLSLSLPDYALRASFIYSESMMESDYILEAVSTLNENVACNGTLKKALLYDRMGYIFTIGEKYRQATLRFAIAGVYYAQLSHFHHTKTFIAGKNWMIVEDYLNEIISKRCLELNYTLEAAMAASNLLKSSFLGAIRQNFQFQLFIKIMNVLVESPVYIFLESIVFTIPMQNKLLLNLRLTNIEILWSFTLPCGTLITSKVYYSTLTDGVALFRSPKIPFDFNQICIEVSPLTFQIYLELKSQPKPIYQDVESLININVSFKHINPKQLKTYLWLCANGSCIVLPHINKSVGKLLKVKLKNSSRSSDSIDKHTIGKLYCLDITETDEINDIDIAISLQPIKPSDFKLEFLVLSSPNLINSKKQNFRISYGHLHLASTKTINFLFNIHQLNLYDIENLVENRYCIPTHTRLSTPPFKLSITPEILSDSIQPDSLTYARLSYNSPTSLYIISSNILPYNKELNILVGSRETGISLSAKSIKHFELIRKDNNKNDLKISKYLLKNNNESLLSVVIFWSCTLKHAQDTLSINGCSLISINLPPEYFEPTPLFQINLINRIPLSFPHSICIRLYYDYSHLSSNKLSQVFIGVAIWNFSEIKFSLNIEARSNDLRSETPILFIGPMNYNLELDPFDIPKQIYKFQAFFFPQQNFDDSMFIFTIKISGQLYSYRLLSQSNTIPPITNF
ncbi:hypothetical protein HZS_6376 [Henneguya salminicola]|nr:hypothetical protein HZS_6376 [Henneguya salminicola]